MWRRRDGRRWNRREGGGDERRRKKRGVVRIQGAGTSSVHVERSEPLEETTPVEPWTIEGRDGERRGGMNRGARIPNATDEHSVPSSVLARILRSSSHAWSRFRRMRSGICRRHRSTAQPCGRTCLPRTHRMASASSTSVRRMWDPKPQVYHPDGCGSRIRVDGCEGDGFDPSEDRAVSTRGDATKARPRPHVQARVPRQKRGRT